MSSDRVDRAFARFVRSGDHRALAFVFDATAPDLLSAAHHLVGDPAAAEDLVQATFLTAIQSCREYVPERPVRHWLTGILTNRVREHRRQSRRCPDPARIAERNVADPLAEVVANELDDAVDSAIAHLPERYRPVLRMHLRHGHSTAEIARALGRAPGTVRKQLARGTEQLRRALPAGLSAGAIGMCIPTRGLGAIRSVVLGKDSGSLGTVATVIAGITIMKPVSWIVAACVLLGAVWTVWPASSEGPQRGGPSRSVPTVLERTDATTAAGTPARSDPGRVAVGPVSAGAGAFAARGFALDGASGDPRLDAEVFLATDPPWDSFFEQRDSAVVRRARGPAAYWRPRPLERLGERIASADSEGRFELPAATTRIGVTVVAPGVPGRSLIVEPGALLPPTVAFELAPERETGVVFVDEVDGRRVIADFEAFVAVRVPGDEPAGSVWLLQQATGRDAAVELRVRDGQQWAVAADAGGFAPTVARFTIDAADRDRRIELRPVTSIAGRVVDGAGHPIADAVVAGRSIGGFLPRPHRSRTASDGRYRVTADAGSSRVVVDHPDFVPASLEPVAADRADVDFVLARASAHRLAGVVLHADVIPAGSARVELWRADRTGTDAACDGLRVGEPFCVAQTDPAGRFAFDSVRDGRYGLDVIAAAQESSEGVSIPVRTRQRITELELSAYATPTFQEITLAPTGTIAVRVATSTYESLLDADDGVPHILLKRVDVTGAKLDPVAQHEAHPNGEIAFCGLAPAKYVVSTLPRSVHEVVDLAAGARAVVTLEISSTALQGRVFENGVPLANCTVGMLREDGRALRIARATTDASGRFSMSGVEAGTWLVRLDAGSTVTPIVRTVVTETARELRLDLPSGGLSIEPGHSSEAVAVAVIAREIAGVSVADRVPERYRTVATSPLANGAPTVVGGLELGRYEVRLVDEAGETVAECTAEVRGVGTSVRFD